MEFSSKKPARRKFSKSNVDVRVVDLFCGIGGLSHGLRLEGFHIVAGIDNDQTCKYSFEINNAAKFITRDVARFSSQELDKLFNDTEVRVLVGCAPCQPYSTLARHDRSAHEARERWYPLYRFMRLIRDVQPEIVSMENVPDLCNIKKYDVFGKFVSMLEGLGYSVFFKVVDASRYGVPQRRNRLVLLASKFGKIELVPETHSEKNAITVRKAIGSLPPLKDGETHANDPLHRASKLSELNKRRIVSTPRNGGSATSWQGDLVPACYRKESGKSYMVTVYGRMRWDDPSPTMTTHCTTLGTGRFGHPDQDRAISLREAARFQSFPDDYVFGDENGIGLTRTAKHIGNAVPVLLGRAIGKSLNQHLKQNGVF